MCALWYKLLSEVTQFLQGCRRDVLIYTFVCPFYMLCFIIHHFPAAGIAPLYCSLFGLFREQDRLWFSPNHIFSVDESASEDVFFRVRYVIVKSCRCKLRRRTPHVLMPSFITANMLLVVTGTTSLAGTAVGHPGLIDMGSPRDQKALCLMTL